MTTLNIFTSIYESIIGTENTGLDYQDAFQGVGILTFFISSGMSLLFYLLLGRWKPVWCKMSHWLLTMLFNSILCSGIALLQARSGVEGFLFGGYVIKFALLNALFGDLIFFITSVAVKRWSIFSNPIPFKWPSKK